MHEVVNSFLLVTNQLMNLANQNQDIIIGFVMPPIIEYLNKDVHKRKGKVFVTVTACIIFSLIFNWRMLLGGSLDQIIESIVLVLGGSQMAYHLYFKNSYVQHRMKESLGKTEVVIPERLIKQNPEKYEKILDI
jgi:hypothetical protein